MSAEIGAIGQYQIAVQQMQMNLIKANIDMQKQTLEILLNSNNRTVSPSENLGRNIDLSV